MPSDKHSTHKVVFSILLYNDNDEPLLPFSTDVLLPVTWRVAGKHQWC